MKWIQRGAIFLIVSGFVSVTFTQFCHLLFRCGCLALWAGAMAFCNIHTSGVPHCPFCSTGYWGAILPFASIFLSQAAIVFIPSKLSAISRLALGILVFPVIGILAGLVFRWWTDYPEFLSPQ